MKIHSTIFSAIIFIVIAFSCKKQPISYTSKMGGKRIWHLMTIVDPGSGYPLDTTYATNTYELIALNNTTISKERDTLHKCESNNPNIISFLKKVDFPSHRAATYDSIAYNYTDNSIYSYFRLNNDIGTIFASSLVEIENTP